MSIPPIIAVCKRLRELYCYADLVRVQVDVRFWWGFSRWAFVHRLSVELVLIRLCPNTKGDSESDPEESKTALTRCEASMLLEHNRESGEESIECPIHDRDVDCEKQYDGFCGNED